MNRIFNKKIVIIFTIIIIIIGGYSLFKLIYKETGTLYSLSISKYYNDFSYDIMFVNRNNPGKEQENPQIYLQAETKSKEILDYLNKAHLKETGKVINTNTTSKINHIIFNQSVKKYNDKYYSALTIAFLDDSHIEINIYYNDIKNNTGYSSSKYYKINNKIDYDYIESILNK